MAREVISDFLHSFRYHVSVSTTDGTVFLGSSAINGTKPTGASQMQPQAGFSAVNTPSGTIDAVEYREGQYIYTRKYPGIPTMDDVTMSRGVALTDTEFFKWFIVAAEGFGEYRADVSIFHFHRHDGLSGRIGTPPTAAEGRFLDKEARKEYKLFDAFPTAHKVAGDLDGTASEISIMDLTVAYERFDVNPGKVAG